LFAAIYGESLDFIAGGDTRVGIPTRTNFTEP
jgi:hypothetical protein